MIQVAKKGHDYNRIDILHVCVARYEVIGIDHEFSEM